MEFKTEDERQQELNAERDEMKRLTRGMTACFIILLLSIALIIIFGVTGGS